MDDEATKRRVKEEVKGLTREEQTILTRVLKIEMEHLHFERPRVKEEILAAFNEVIK